MRWLYHILPRGTQFLDSYAPATFKTERFIHASFQPDVLESARLYFPPGAPIAVMQIDPQRVRHEVVATPRGPMPHVTTAIRGIAIAAIFDLELIAQAPDELVAPRAHLPFPAKDVSENFARHVPFGDPREVLIRRGPWLSSDLGLPSVSRRVVLHGITVSIIRYRSLISPPVLRPGQAPMDARSAAAYKPEHDIAHLPDADIVIRREPDGFSDDEVERILAAIDFTS